MNKVVALFFALACFSTSFASNSIMGAGMWFYIIIATGLFVFVSQFSVLLRDLGRTAALILAAMSVCAVVLTLLAATIGGSFSLDEMESLMIVSFSMIAVLGATLYVFGKEPERE